MSSELVRLVRGLASDELRKVERMIADGVVDALEGGYASVRIGDPSSQPLPGFVIDPSLDVQPGDHVLVYRLGGYQLVLAVLNRNALAVEVEGLANPMTTVGDLIVGVEDGAEDRLGKPSGLTTPMLTVDQDTGLFSWIEAPAGGGGVSDGDKGDITVSSSGAVWTIDNDAVSYAKMQNVSATSRLLGRKTAGAGDPEELTVQDVLSFGAGTSFPGSPATNARFFRTDLGMEFVFDGTRWLSTQRYQLMVSQPTGMSASAAFRHPAPFAVGTDLWLVRAYGTYAIQAGGTALSGSHKWDVALSSEAFGAGLGGGTSLATWAVNSGNSNEVRILAATAIGALLGGDALLRSNFTKTGTPGVFHGGVFVEYRHVAT